MPVFAMRRLVVVLLAMLWTLLAGPAIAGQTPPSSPPPAGSPTPGAPPAPRAVSGTFGFMTLFIPTYPGSDHFRVLPFPIATVEYHSRLFAGPLPGIGVGGGLRVWRTRTWNASVALGIGDGRPESRGDALAGMGDRGMNITSTISLGYRHGPLDASVDVAHGFRDDAGWTAIATLGGHRLIGHRWMASGQVRATLVDRDQMRYLFGIDATQAARREALVLAGDPRLHADELGVYAPDGGLQSVGAGGTLAYIITRHWSALGLVNAARLQDEAAHSPLVRQRGQVSTGVGLAYRF